MKIFQGPLVLLNVVSPKNIQLKTKINEMLQFSRYFDFQNKFYQIGPDVLSILPQQGESDYVEYEFFLSLNLPLDIPEENENFRVFNKYLIENTISTRIADNDERYFDYDQRLRDYLNNHYDIEVSPKTYFVITDNLGEKIVDIYIEVLGGRLN